MILKSYECAFFEQVHLKVQNYFKNDPIPTVSFELDPSIGPNSLLTHSGFLAGVAIVLVQKQLSKGDDIELKSSLTSTNETEDFALSYDADDYYTEIDEIEIIEPDVKIESRSKKIKKGTDEFYIEYFERYRSLSFDPFSSFSFPNRLSSLRR